MLRGLDEASLLSRERMQGLLLNTEKREHR